MAQATDIEGLDKGIERAVFLLREAGIETFASCDGGKGHPYSEPTIRFEGNHDEGFVALGVVLFNALPVSALRRVWRMIGNEPTGPFWELVFVSAPKTYDTAAPEVFGEFARLNLEEADDV